MNHSVYVTITGQVFYSDEQVEMMKEGKDYVQTDEQAIEEIARDAVSDAIPDDMNLKVRDVVISYQSK